MPRVSAIDNAATKLLLDDIGVRDARGRAITRLERLGLGERLERTPEQLSDGAGARG
jgi:predicted ABC-type transport system involved in lysophospholipase L1 biosynthesis ATPase subunit